MRRLKALFVPHPVAHIQTPWGDNVLAVVGDRHEIRVFDRTQAAEPQFHNVEVIVDLGGNMSPNLIEAAGLAGVKFVQAQTNGLDPVEDQIRDAGMMLAHCPGDLSSVALAELDAFAEEPPDPSRPVYPLPNVCITPDTAGSTDGTSRKRASFAADHLDRYARGEKIEARVV